MDRREIREKISRLYSIMESTGRLQLRWIGLPLGVKTSLDFLALLWYPQENQMRIQYTLEDLLVLGHLLNMISTEEELRIVLEEIVEYKKIREMWMPRLRKYYKDKTQDRILRRYELVLRALSEWGLRIDHPWNRILVPSGIFLEALKSSIIKDRRTVKRSLLEFMSLELIKIKVCKLPPNPSSCIDLKKLAENLAKIYHESKDKRKAREEIYQILIETGLSELTKNRFNRTLNFFDNRRLSLQAKHERILNTLITSISSSDLYSPTVFIEVLILPLEESNMRANEDSINEMLRALYYQKT